MIAAVAGAIITVTLLLGIAYETLILGRFFFLADGALFAYTVNGFVDASSS